MREWHLMFRGGEVYKPIRMDVPSYTCEDGVVRKSHKKLPAAFLLILGTAALD